jgi:signal transduction histidine kinase
MKASGASPNPRGASWAPITHQYERLPLLAQSLMLGLLVAALLGAVQWSQKSQWQQNVGTDATQVLMWSLGFALLPLLAAAWPVWRASQALRRIATGTRALTREDEQDDEPVPYEAACDELHEASVSLRRAVDFAKRRRQALMAQNAALGAKLQTRTQELSTLQDLSIRLAAEPEVTGLVNEALGALGQAMLYSSASVWTRAGLDADQPVVLTGYITDATDMAGVNLKDLTGLRLSRANLQRYEQIEAEGQPIIENRPKQGLLSWLWAMVTDDARTSALYRNTKAWMAVPLKVHQQVFGVLRVDHDQPDYFDPERIRLLSAVAGQTALALSHAHSLTLQRDAAVVTERSRIARELHDAVSQTLFAANLLAGSLALAANTDADTRQQVQMLERLNRSALAEMRMMLFELRPDALINMRLPDLLQQAVEALAGRGDIDVQTHFEELAAVPEDTRVQIYRIAQEALSNIARHSGAHNVKMQWHVAPSKQARLSISDDGVGFDTEAAAPGHFGVANIRDRAAALGANLVLKSAPGEGTELVLELNWS